MCSAINCLISLTWSICQFVIVTTYYTGNFTCAIWNVCAEVYSHTVHLDFTHWFCCSLVCKNYLKLKEQECVSPGHNSHLSSYRRSTFPSLVSHTVTWTCAVEQHSTLHWWGCWWWSWEKMKKDLSNSSAPWLVRSETLRCEGWMSKRVVTVMGNV